MAGGVALVALLAAFRPLSVVGPGAGLDDSWITVLGEAGGRQVRWGVDLAFSYGPASTLLTRYVTDHSFSVDLPFWLCAALGLGLVVALLVREPAAEPNGVGPILMAGTAQAVALASQANQDLDAVVFVLAFDLFLLDLARPRWTSVERALLLGGSAVLGILASAKTSLGLFGLILLGMADLRALLLHRRGPWLSLSFCLAALAAFLACGQHIADLPTFLLMQWSFAAGYADAMATDGKLGEVLAFGAASLGLILVAALYAPVEERRWAALGLACALLLVLKAGFVRADTHTQIAWSFLGLAGVAVAAALVLPRSKAAAGRLALASIAVLWVLAPAMLILDAHRPKRWSELAVVYADLTGTIGAEAANWTQFLPSPAGFAEQAQADKATSWEEVRARVPVPRLEGSIDMLGSRQSAILAQGLDYRPRPSFQDYASYHRRLIEANVAHYAGSAPDWVLLDLDPIDGRYPAFTEGALWPTLLRSYDVVGPAGPFLLLRAHAAASPFVSRRQPRAEIRLGEAFPVPPGIVFARITVQKTLAGQLASLMFRIPLLHLDVTTADGAERRYRFVPAIARDGFLLSPAVTARDHFTALSHGDVMPSRQVVSASIRGSGLAGLFYRPDLLVEFDRLDAGPTSTDEHGASPQGGS